MGPVAAWLLALTLAAQSPAPPVDPAAAWPDVRPVTHLFQNLGTDVVGLRAADTLWLAAAGGAGAIAAHPADDDVASWAIDQPASSYTKVGRMLGDGWVQGGGAIATYLVGLAAHDARITHVGGDLVRAQALNGLITTGIKVSVRRQRPDHGNRHAFPSGHTSASFATAAVLQGHFGWKAAAPAYALGGFIGWTRIRDHKHWLSDVVMGAAIGTIAGHTVTSGHRARTWRIVPAKTDGGFAVYVVKVPAARVRAPARRH